MHLKIVKVSSNDTTPLIYIPKEIRKRLRLEKGTYVKLKIQGNKLIIEPITP